MKPIMQTGFACLLSACFIFNTYADQSQMNQTLVQVVEQLQQLKPLIAEAQMQEPANLRDSVHLTAYTSPNGQMQNGVMDDVNALQEGIEQIINLKQIDPKAYAPISGDYVEGN